MKHTENVQAFEKLLGFCTGLGGKYKPGNQNLHVTVMQSVLAKAQQALNELRAAANVRKQAMIHRNNVYAKAEATASGISHVLRVSEADPQIIDFAAKVNRRMYRGVSGSVFQLPANAEEKLVKKSGYGHDFESRLQRFSDLVDMVGRDPHYTPGGARYAVAALWKQVAELRAALVAVKEAELAWKQALSKRDTLFYSGPQSLNYLMLTVKSYFRAELGAADPDYKLIKGLRFTKLIS